MRLRRFTAPTMEEAMAQVRRTLGPDAIIVSTHEARRGGGVEVTAAIEDDMVPARVPAPVQARAAAARAPSPPRRSEPEDDGRFEPDWAKPTGREARAAPRAPTPIHAQGHAQSHAPAGADWSVSDWESPDGERLAPAPRRAPAQAVGASAHGAAATRDRAAPEAQETWVPLRRAWPAAPPEAVVNASTRPPRPAPIRHLGAGGAGGPQSAPAGSAPRRPEAAPVADRQAAQPAPPATPGLSARDRVIAQALDFHSVPRPLAEALFRAARAIDVDEPVDALAHALDTRLVFAPLAPVPRRPTMVIGPVGAGKTVTAAKIAARAVLNGERIDIVTLDTLRAGALAQIEAYANVLEQDLGIEETSDGLADRLSALVDGQAVVIDTPGVNPFSVAEMADLALFVAAAADIDPILVLPAGGDAREGFEIAQAFRNLGAKRLIVTRLDAARRLGGLMAAADAGLTLAQVSQSPYLADGLTTINPMSLARLLLDPVTTAPKDPKVEAASP